MQTQKEIHQAILEQLYEKYSEQDDTVAEFTWDGPSDWDQWESSNPRILFLVKESRNGYHPNLPKQKLSNKFSQNIGRWKNVIRYSIIGKSIDIENEGKNLIPTDLDDIAVVEVKKLNEENFKSSRETILEYAKADKLILKQQIEVIAPQIIICCGTTAALNIIYDDSYNDKVKLVTERGVDLWHLGKRLILDFYHPTTNNSNRYDFEDENRIHTLKAIFSHDLVRHTIGSL